MMTSGGCVEPEDVKLATAASEPNIARAEELAVIAVRGALKDAYQHGYRDGMKRGQEMAAWGYMTADGLAASRAKAEGKAKRKLPES